MRTRILMALAPVLATGALLAPAAHAASTATASPAPTQAALPASCHPYVSTVVPGVTCSFYDDWTTNGSASVNAIHYGGLTGASAAGYVCALDCQAVGVYVTNDHVGVYSCGWFDFQSPPAGCTQPLIYQHLP